MSPSCALGSSVPLQFFLWQRLEPVAVMITVSSTQNEIALRMYTAVSHNACYWLSPLKLALIVLRLHIYLGLVWRFTEQLVVH
jgi:hypothetical protein